MSTVVFDHESFYEALDGHRHALKLTWRDISKEAGVSASTLTRIGQGKRPDVDSLAKLCTWANLDTNKFVRTNKVGETKEEEPMAVIPSLLRSDQHLSPANADALLAIINTAYEKLSERDV